MEANEPPANHSFTERFGQKLPAKPKLLICDDDETLLQLFKEVYARRGFDPVAVLIYDGPSADLDMAKGTMQPAAAYGLNFVDYAIQKPEQIRQVMQQVKPDAVLSDMQWRDTFISIPNGKALVDEVKRCAPTVPTVIHSGDFNDTGKVDPIGGYNVVAKSTGAEAVADFLQVQIARNVGRAC